jgi:hypothetical protein
VSDFVRVDADEQLDFDASKKALQSLAQACHKRGLERALLDLRAVPVPNRQQFTTTELATLVSTFREAGFTRQQRLALLYHHDVYGGVRNFAFISRMRGLEVQAFSDFETALQWLSEEKVPKGEAQPAEVPIPISQPLDESKKVPVAVPAGKRAGRSRSRRSSA